MFSLQNMKRTKANKRNLKKRKINPKPRGFDYYFDIHYRIEKSIQAKVERELASKEVKYIQYERLIANPVKISDNSTILVLHIPFTVLKQMKAYQVLWGYSHRAPRHFA